MASQRSQTQVWTLLVGGLDDVLDGAAPAPRDGPLSRLLARSSRRQLPVRGRRALIGWIVTGAADAVRRWPPGPIMFAGGNGEAAPAGIMCADPVTLSAVGDGLVIQGPRSLELSPGETEALAEALTEGLRGGDLQFRVRGGHWFLQGDAAPAVEWWEPDEIDGQDVLPHMPGGDSARRLRAFMTEAQMILHEHPVNTARSHEGRPVANGLWPWGWCSGESSGPPSADVSVSGDDYARGLVRLAGGSTAEADPINPDGSALIVLDSPGASGDRDAWLRNFDEAWCGPLMDALRQRAIGELRLAAPGGRCHAVTRRDLTRFWRGWWR